MRIKRRYFLAPILFLAACVSSGDVAKTNGLTFIHLNDTYRIDAVEEGRRGGFGRVATLIRDLQAEGRDVRLLHGGDFLYPSLESQLWGGEQMIEALNFLDDLAPLYVVPGNHEFDPRSAESLISRVRESKFEWLADNIRFATGDVDVDGRLRAGFTFTSGNRRIGVFALTVHPDDGGNVREFTPFEEGYVALAEKAITKLENEGVDLIVGVTHLHLGDDIEVAALRARHPKFMFMVGGHEHEPEYEAGSASHATIMKGASNARVVWRIDVTFDGDAPQINETRIDVDESIAIDDDYRQFSDQWRTRLLALIPFLESRVGEASVPLDGREVAVRNSESNWGNFIADQMRSAFRDPPSDFAFINSGTLRLDDFVADDITFEDIGRTFGFSSFLRHMTMNGAEFRKMLEAGYRGVGPSKGYFPQVSGFRVCVDRRRPDGQRIVQMLVPDEDGWSEIDLTKDYLLVAPDFIYRGGDGYDFSAAKDVSRPGSELKYLVLDGIIRAQAEGKAIGDAIDPGAARIAFVAGGNDKCFH